jgi:hypothetical protein
MSRTLRHTSRPTCAVQAEAQFSRMIPEASTRLTPPPPLEWMDPGSWCLPSGRTLAEFALGAGFAAPLLMTPPGKADKTLGNLKVRQGVKDSGSGRR